MDTWCKSGFTAKTLLAADQSKVYQYDTGNTPIVIADHTTYYESVHNKDTCKLKSCTWVIASSDADDATYASYFEVVLLT